MGRSISSMCFVISPLLQLRILTFICFLGEEEEIRKKEAEESHAADAFIVDASRKEGFRGSSEQQTALTSDVEDDNLDEVSFRSIKGISQKEYGNLLVSCKSWHGQVYWNQEVDAFRSYDTLSSDIQ